MRDGRQRKTTKDDMQDVISGEGEVSHGTTIQAAIDYLGKSPRPGVMAKTDKLFKQEETKRLKACGELKSRIY
jgi:hypothetical protein